MTERDLVRLYQTAARIWFALALFALLLPPAMRLGIWLPLHLALAGAVSVAICGAIAMFAQVLTAGPPHPQALHLAQFALVNAGAALITVGMATQAWIPFALGGLAFLASMVLLAIMVLRCRRRGLNRRHPVPLWLYLIAIACVFVGASIGALQAMGIIHPAHAPGARSAHLSLNLLGWASLAIVATLITLFPTVLKVKMVRWDARGPAVALSIGVAAVAAGLAFDLTALALAGTASYLAGALSVLWMMGRTLATRRKHGFPVTARHMVAAAVWWLVGIAVLIPTIAGDAWAIYRDVFLIAAIGGWVLQTLLGTWLYLLPMWRPGSPEERAGWVRFVGFGGWAEVVSLNGGLALLVTGRMISTNGGPLGVAGVALVIATALFIFAKVALFPVASATRG